MRTTVTLDPDVEALLKNAMREQDASFKQVLNDAVRLGLRRRGSDTRAPFEQMTFDMGGLLVATTSLNALADELEDGELVAKLAQGR
jgi:hypothetical protein